MRNPFSVDWECLEDVVQYARELGKGMSVIKYPERKNYNITHTKREKDLSSTTVRVIYRT